MKNLEDIVANAFILRHIVCREKKLKITLFMKIFFYLK